MATANDVYGLIKYIATKTGYNGNISPNDFNLVFPQSEQTYYNKLYDQYMAKQSISESLSVFMSDPTSLTIDAQGKVNTPADLLHIDAVMHTYNSIPMKVRRVEKSSLADNLSSNYDSPDEEFPIYTQYSTYMQFYPVSLSTATLIYLKRLTATKWGYTIVNGRPQYDQNSSVNPKWLDSDINRVVSIALGLFGINMRDTEVQQYSLQRQQMNQ